MDDPGDPTPDRGAQRRRSIDAAERARQMYDGLVQVARFILKGERVDLRVTELAHETWLRRASDLFETNPPGQAYGLLCKWTRQTLIDLIREQRAQRRGGGRVHVPIDESLADVPSELRECEPEELDQALDKLRGSEPRAFDVVSLHVFGGMPMPAVARVLGVSLVTVERDWRHARAFLRAELMGTAQSDIAGDGAPS